MTSGKRGCDASGRCSSGKARWQSAVTTLASERHLVIGVQRASALEGAKTAKSSHLASRPSHRKNSSERCGECASYGGELRELEIGVPVPRLRGCYPAYRPPRASVLAQLTDANADPIKWNDIFLEDSFGFASSQPIHVRSSQGKFVSYRSSCHVLRGSARRTRVSYSLGWASGLSPAERLEVERGSRWLTSVSRPTLNGRHLAQKRSVHRFAGGQSRQGSKWSSGSWRKCRGAPLSTSARYCWGP